MTRDEFRQVISFVPLRRWMFVHALYTKVVAREAGLDYRCLMDVMEGKSLPSTETIARICSVLNCTPGDIMEFRGMEVKDVWTQKVPFTKGCSLTYEPLRNWIDRKFPDTSFTDCMRKVDRLEPEEHCRGLRLGGAVVGMASTTGLFMNQIADIRNDRSVNVRIIYNISKAFGLPVDMIMGCRK